MNFSVLNRTSSQICGNWYLPMFLFRDGSFPQEYNSFCCSSEILWFSTHSGKIVHTSMMACGFWMFINRGRGLKVFFKLYPKSSCRLPNILLITLYPVTLILIYYFFFLYDYILIFVGHKGGFDGIATFEVYMYPMFTADDLKELTRPFCKRHYHVDVVFFFC